MSVGVDFSSLDQPERTLRPEECAELAKRAAALVDPAGLERTGPGTAALLWRTAHSEAWLNTWWQARDSGYHDHDGSCGGVYVIEGSATTEGIRLGGPREAREVAAGEAFSFGGDAVHRVDHHPGAVTVHVYSPPLRSIGSYELVDGELRRTRCAPDEMSPSSDMLTAWALRQAR